MKKIKILCLLLIILISGIIFAEANNAHSQEFSAQQILENVDKNLNAPNDQEITIKMILIDKTGNEKVREAKIWQKGSEKRMLKFFAPADIKGLAFLNLPDDIMYLYLPAFKKIRKIASHVKNTDFAGTDFSYDDMSSINYADIYNVKLLEGNSTSKKSIKEQIDAYILELVPKKNVKKEYSKLIMLVRIDNYYPIKIEFFSKDGKKAKVMENSKIEKEGKYWIAKEVIMHDLNKDHKTQLIITEVKFDQKLSDDLFTKRYLKRK